MVEPDTGRAERTRRFRLRPLPIVVVALIALVGLDLFPGEDASQSQDMSRNQEPFLNLPAPEDIQAVADYRERAERICTATHARLHEELEATGIELHSDDPSILKAEQRIMGEMLKELRAVRPPEEVQRHFDHVFGLMEQFANGEEMPYVSDAEFWVHQVTNESSLSECASHLPG